MAIDTMKQLGVAGAVVRNGYVFEEFLPELQGERGRRMYREMSDNDPTIGGLLMAIDSHVRGIEWRVMPSPDDTQAEGATFFEQVLQDMEIPWTEVVSEILTMLIFGWSYFEVVYKRRVGPDELNAERRSRFTDGKIGIRRIASRAQETLDRWEFDEHVGEILGMWQQHPSTFTLIPLPMERCLLFRTTSRKNNPEGRSILRTAYRPYYFMKQIQMIEAIAIERELAGLPVVRVPNYVLTEDQHAMALAKYQKLARDVKFNEQGGVVIPSDTYTDDQGNISNVPLVTLELLNAGGSRAIDTDTVIKRYQADIARSALADFLILGASDAGSFALSKSKTSLFLNSLKSIVNSIACVINEDLIPRLWAINGLDYATIPTLKPDKISPVDLTELGAYIKALSDCGLYFAGDEETEAILREMAGLPGEMVKPNRDLEPPNPTDLIEPVQGPQDDPDRTQE